MTNNIGPRSEVRFSEPDRPGNGSSRSWSREIYGQLYRFTAVLMPNGDRRYAIDKFNGYVGGTSWACAWDRVHFITIKPRRLYVAGGGWSPSDGSII